MHIHVMMTTGNDSDPTSTYPNLAGNQQIPGFSCAVANCLCLIIVSVADIETAPYRP